MNVNYMMLITHIIYTPVACRCFIQAGHPWYKSVFKVHPCLRTPGDDVETGHSGQQWALLPSSKCLPLIPKVARLNPAIESCFLHFCFKPIPNMNPYLNQLMFMPKLNLKLVEMLRLENMGESLILTWDWELVGFMSHGREPHHVVLTCTTSSFHSVWIMAVIVQGKRCGGQGRVLFCAVGLHWHFSCWQLLF